MPLWPLPSWSFESTGQARCGVKSLPKSHNVNHEFCVGQVYSEQEPGPSLFQPSVSAPVNSIQLSVMAHLPGAAECAHAYASQINSILGGKSFAGAGKAHEEKGEHKGRTFPPQAASMSTNIVEDLVICTVS